MFLANRLCNPIIFLNYTTCTAQLLIPVLIPIFFRFQNMGMLAADTKYFSLLLIRYVLIRYIHLLLVPNYRHLSTNVPYSIVTGSHAYY